MFRPSYTDVFSLLRLPDFYTLSEKVLSFLAHIKGSVSMKADDCPNESEFIVGYARFVRHDYLYNGCELH